MISFLSKTPIICRIMIIFAKEKSLTEEEHDEASGADRGMGGSGLHGAGTATGGGGRRRHTRARGASIAVCEGGWPVSCRHQRRAGCGTGVVRVPKAHGVAPELRVAAAAVAARYHLAEAALPRDGRGGGDEQGAGMDWREAAGGGEDEATTILFAARHTADALSYDEP